MVRFGGISGEFGRAMVRIYIRGSIFISVYNFTAQYRASFGNQSILKFRAREVPDTSLGSSLLKKIPGGGLPYETDGDARRLA